MLTKRKTRTRLVSSLTRRCKRKEKVMWWLRSLTAIDKARESTVGKLRIMRVMSELYSIFTSNKPIIYKTI